MLLSQALSDEALDELVASRKVTEPIPVRRAA
jgi:hypothetical protein